LGRGSPKRAEEELGKTDPDRDNPWFGETSLRADMEELYKRDYQAYLHVWEGYPKSAVEGAVYHDEMIRLEAAGQITDVAVDRLRPVDTFWDLGFGDANAIWMAQAMPTGQVRVVDYLQNRGKAIEWYLIQLQNRGYLYGTDWLPHDGVDAIIHRRLSGDPSRSVEQLMRTAGRNVRISPKLHRNTGINAVRSILPNCWIDRTKCNDGLRALRSYQWGPVSAGGQERREPLHDWASHGADAFRTMAVCVKYPDAPVVQPTSSYQQSNRKGGARWMGL
jgi:phage terminase large subunit